MAQPPGSGAPSSAPTSGLIYLARRGWHVDIGFAVPALEPPLQSLGAQFPGARYLFFGFGDRHYLLAKHRNGPVLLGALWPGPGLILLTALTSTPQAAFGEEHVIALTVSLGQARAAQAFIVQSLSADNGQALGAGGRQDAADGIQPYAPGPYEDSSYFATTAKYSALHTCNTWVAEALKAARLPVHSGGVIFAGQLWRQVRRVPPRRASLPVTDQSQGGLEPF